jgi:hypothetical protein
MTEYNDKITLNQLYRMHGIIIPEPFLGALEKAYTPEECIKLLSVSISTSKNLKVIDPELINKYIKPKNNLGLLK